MVAEQVHLYFYLLFPLPPSQHTHNFPLHDLDKSNADWIDCEPIKYGPQSDRI